MPDFQTLSGTVEVRYYPDQYTETEVREGASWPLGAGRYEVGVNVDGAWLPLAGFKGGGVQKKLAAAKKARESKQPAQQQSSSSESQQQSEHQSAAQSEQQQSPPSTTTSTAWVWR